MKQLLRTLILLLVRLLGAPGAYRAFYKRRPASSTPLHVLLLRPDHLGDLVMTTPVLNALKAQLPNAQITMMIGPWSSEVVTRHPAIDRLITCPFPGFRRAAQNPLAPYMLLFRTAQQLRRGKYDVAINLRPDFWWGAALIYLAGIPQRIGYALQPGMPFLTHAEPFREAEHSTVYNLRLVSAALKELGHAPLVEPYTPERYPLVFVPTAVEQAWVVERLRAADTTNIKDRIVVIHPGTGAAVKLWRNTAWTICANALPSLLTISAPVRIILTGSKAEREMLEEIERGITSSALLITDATVGQLAALLQQACLVLGVDAGPLHLAVAQGTPTIQLFGPTDAHIYGPWGTPEKHIVIASTQRCPTCPAIPCGRLDFRPEELVDHPCVRLIPEQRVLEAIPFLVGMQGNTIL